MKNNDMSPIEKSNARFIFVILLFILLIIKFIE